MKLPALMLMALLALSSASLQDAVKKKKDRKVSILNPQLENLVPEVTGKYVSLASSPIFGDNVNLEWVTWDGSLPNGAVSIYNSETSRTDYVCKYNCEAGFYNPRLGPKCRYPYGDNEHYASRFQILVNKDNFEFLEWRDGSYGSVPQNSVRTCMGGDVYVGKNEYGLGKVVTRFKAFFLPWEGDEYWYKEYQVLTINRDAYSQRISDVKYAMNEAALFKYPPESMRTSVTTNNNCQILSKKVTLSKTTSRTSTWNIGRETKLGTEVSITTQIPFVGEGSVKLSAEMTFKASQGNSRTEQLSHSVSVSLTVPPNHTCRVHMEGRKIKADVPYTARLSRTYRNGKTKWTTITGTYNGVQIGEIRAMVDRCVPVANAKPCPSEAQT